MDSPVLDSSAILAVIFNEPGGERVAPLLQRALLSTVNLAEVHTQLLLRGAPSDFAWSRILSLGFQLCHFDENHARMAAELIARTKALGLSLADRACLALAIQRQSTVYTTNRAWQSLDLDIEVEVIR